MKEIQIQRYIEQYRLGYRGGARLLGEQNCFQLLHYYRMCLYRSLKIYVYVQLELRNETKCLADADTDESLRLKHLNV